MSYQDDYYERPRHISNAPIWMAAFAIAISAAVFQLWLFPDILHAPNALRPAPTARIVRQPASAASAGAADADSQRRYNDTVATAAALSGPLPNTDVTGDDAPVLRVSKPDAREHNVQNVPTAEPLPDPQASDAFGSKPVRAAPIDIQATHQCLHGQHWTKSGCRNPTP